MKKEDVRHILVIRFRRVGDSVLCMALCRSLKETFPDAKLDLVINKGIHTLYENHPDVDGLVVFDDKDNHNFLRYLRKVWHTMRRTRYYIIIDMRSTVKTAWFSLFSLRSPYRIGRKKWYGRWILTHRIDNQGASHGSKLDQNFMLMEPLAEIAPLHKTRNFRLHVDERQVQTFRQYMEEKGIDFSRPVVLVAAATRLAYKGWPRDRMAEILRRMKAKFDVQLVFNYAAGERDAVFAYRPLIGEDERTFFDIEARSLPELCCLTSCCDFFFGNEGGPRHIAQAFHVPSLAIYPPGISTTVWLPDGGDRYRGISPDDVMSREEQNARQMSYQERMALITVENVWQELQKMLKTYTAAQ